MPRALIWGESLVGGGHARIQSELARHLQAEGWQVGLITGSREQASLFDFGAAELFYQPPLRMAGSDPYNMTNLLTPDGLSLFADEAYRCRRRDRLLATYRDFRPDIVVTEMWPYARANFDFELVPLARAIEADHAERAAPPLYSIARDIMFPPRLSSPDSPGLENDRHALAGRFFRPGCILVRGDQRVIALEQSIGPIPEAIRDRIDYVGYFASSQATGQHRAEGAPRDVLVSSGGGVTADSLALFRHAIAARRHSALQDHVWRIIIPASCPAEQFDAITAEARAESPEGGIVVERNRRDFLSLLADAALLICHAGNTVIEALTARVPVLVVPRELAKNNLEQQVRAQSFQDQGLIGLVRLADLGDPRHFAGHIDNAATVRPAAAGILIDGAARMAKRITSDWQAVNPQANLPSKCQERLSA